MTTGTAHSNLPAQPGSQSVSATGEPSSDEPPQPSSGLVIDVVFDDGDWACLPDVETLVANVAKAVSQRRELKVDDTAATLALSSDAVVARLNGTYRGKPRPTNVLSFPAPPLPVGVETPGEPRALGDVILALETVLSEARDLGISPAHHVQHLTLHGLLHLLGYDHETDDDATTMEALETDILATLGVGDPYALGRVS
jgi:probable rRNA maturation factor